MPSNRFDQAKPFLTLAIVVVTWLIVPVAFKSLLRASFFELQAPISVSASHLRDLQDFWGLKLHSQKELIEAGRNLARINASYDLAVQQNSQLRDHLERLNKLLNVPAQPAYRLEHARVVRRDFSAWWQQLTIRKGSDFGITVGAPVVFSGGVVGRVTAVHAYTSTVELISSPGVRLAAVVEGDDRPMSFQGGLNPTFGPARGVIEFVPIDIFSSAMSTKRLVTSGLGGVFPAGLTLGRVVKLEPSTDGLFKTGEVELDPRLSELIEVTVLVPGANE